VRKLEQQIGTVCRKVARKIAEGRTEKIVITPRSFMSFWWDQGAGRHGDCRATKRAASCGARVDACGGDILFIEAQDEGQRRVQHHRQIGDVMKNRCRRR